jgi:hypothetical protein
MRIDPTCSCGSKEVERYDADEGVTLGDLEPIIYRHTSNSTRCRTALDFLAREVKPQKVRATRLGISERWLRGVESGKVQAGSKLQKRILSLAAAIGLEAE